jgi:hypothetical protein
MAKHEEPEGLEFFRRATEDLRLAKRRRALARFSTNIFSGAGNELHLLGHIIGTDRVSGASPLGHGTDETVAISVLLRIASQLVSASADLFKDGRAYAAAALLRQLVEIEYLAWAFETRHHDAERWLRSDQKERAAFFRPAKLRAAASGRFRGLDYSFHCELGDTQCLERRYYCDQRIVGWRNFCSLTFLGILGGSGTTLSAGHGTAHMEAPFLSERKQCRGGSPRGSPSIHSHDYHHHRP